VNEYSYTVDLLLALNPCRVTDPTGLTTAVGDMETAAGAGRTLPDALNLGAGEIGGLPPARGRCKWTGNVAISTTSRSRVARTAYGSSRLPELLTKPPLRM
jgi:hypothetical protein